MKPATPFVVTGELRSLEGLPVSRRSQRCRYRSIVQIRDRRPGLENLGLELRVHDDQVIASGPGSRCDEEVPDSHPFAVREKRVLESSGFECGRFRQVECPDAPDVMPDGVDVGRTTT